MSGRDFTREERAEIREMVREHKAGKLALASTPPDGAECCGQAGRFSIYKLVGQVLTLVAVLTLPECAPVSVSRGIAIVEMPIRLLAEIMPEPGPRRDHGDYPREMPWPATRRTRITRA